MSVLFFRPLLALLALVCTLDAFAQPATLWSEAYGGSENDDGYGVAATQDGVVAVGRTRSFGAGLNDLWLVKTDLDGDTLWTRTYGGNGADEGRGIVELANGDFLIAGKNRSPGDTGDDFWLLRVDAMGHEVWSTELGGDLDDDAWDVAPIPGGGGGGYAAGMTRSFGAGSYDLWLVRFGASGDSSWTRTFGGEAADGGYAVCATPDGGCAAAGFTTSSGEGEADFWLVRTDGAGQPLWTRSYGGPGEERALALATCADGGFALAGRTTSWGAGGTDAWLVRTDSDGDTLWTRSYGGAGTDYALCVRETVDGDFLVGGSTGPTGTGDAWLLKVDSAGDELWSATWGGAGQDSFADVDVAPDGTLALAGSTNSEGAGLNDVTIVRLEADGTGVSPRMDRPSGFALGVPFPNPFNPGTTIPVRLSAAGDVSLTVHDLTGRAVRTLLAGPLPAGEHETRFDAAGLPSGLYVARLTTASGSQARKLLLVK